MEELNKVSLNYAAQGLTSEAHVQGLRQRKPECEVISGSHFSQGVTLPF